MSTRLEQFISDHRDEFDTDLPSSRVWDTINQKLEPGKGGETKQGPVVRMTFLKWSIAAAVLVVAVAGIWFVTRTGSGRETNAVALKDKQPSQQENSKTSDVAVSGTDNGKKQDAGQQGTVPGPDTKQMGAEPSASDSQGEINEEMYHYAKIVELRQKELRKIEKDEPLLYKQFSGDVNKLDSVYRSLKKQLNINPNREQLLEAMIQNLQLQIGLLNHQLDIIKQINHSKKSAYENAYKTI